MQQYFVTVHHSSGVICCIFHNNAFHHRSYDRTLLQNIVNEPLYFPVNSRELYAKNTPKRKHIRVQYSTLQYMYLYTTIVHGFAHERYNSKCIYMHTRIQLNMHAYTTVLIGITIHAVHTVC